MLSCKGITLGFTSAFDLKSDAIIYLWTCLCIYIHEYCTRKVKCLCLYCGQYMWLCLHFLSLSRFSSYFLWPSAYREAFSVRVPPTKAISLLLLSRFFSINWSILCCNLFRYWKGFWNCQRIGNVQIAKPSMYLQTIKLTQR